MSERTRGLLSIGLAFGILAVGYAAFNLNEAKARNVQDLLLIIEPVTHEVLGDLEWRGNRYVFVDCFGAEYEMKSGYQIRTTQDLC
jgi:hypothetical protein